MVKRNAIKSDPVKTFLKIFKSNPIWFTGNATLRGAINNVVYDWYMNNCPDISLEADIKHITGLDLASYKKYEILLKSALIDIIKAIVELLDKREKRSIQTDKAIQARKLGFHKWLKKNTDFEAKLAESKEIKLADSNMLGEISVLPHKRPDNYHRLKDFVPDPFRIPQKTAKLTHPLKDK